MGALLSRYAELDVRRNVNRRVPGCVTLVFDHGPQRPKATDVHRLRRYALDRAQWELETGNKPVELGLNSVDASAAKLYDPMRWRTSATAPAEKIPAQQTTTPQQFVYVGCGGQAALPCGHLSDLLNPGVTLVLFSVDFWAAVVADQRYQIIKTP
jgi:hypothetical protein